MYDEYDNHVGVNYDTGEIEKQIPGAEYSGSNTRPEWIEISENTDSINYKTRVVALSTDESGTNYAVVAREVPAISAIMEVFPKNINFEMGPDQSKETIYLISETGRSSKLSGVTLTATDLIHESGVGMIDSSSIQFSSNNFDIDAGNSTQVLINVTTPKGVIAGTYSGIITAKDNSGAVDTTQVNININPAECPLDMNDDGYVNAQDIVYLLTHGEWGNNQGHVWDLNDDNYVNAQDVVYALTHGLWGACP